MFYEKEQEGKITTFQDLNIVGNVTQMPPFFAISLTRGNVPTVKAREQKESSSRSKGSILPGIDWAEKVVEARLAKKKLVSKCCFGNYVLLLLPLCAKQLSSHLHVSVVLQWDKGQLKKPPHSLPHCL